MVKKHINDVPFEDIAAVVDWLLQFKSSMPSREAEDMIRRDGVMQAAMKLKADFKLDS